MPHLMLGALDPIGVVMTVVGLGGLIFFHELGHFLACRLTGTRVEAFSIGFGPELFGWTRGPTRYKVSLVPLGGYVKMAAENPGDARTDDPDEFPNKSFGQKFFIMVNGVVFNLLLAFLFFAWAFGIGVPFQKAEVGRLAEGGAAWEAGLRIGDVVTHVGDQPVLGFEDLGTAVAFTAQGEVLDLTVRRGAETLRIPLEARYSSRLGMPTIGVDASIGFRAAGVVEDSPVARAGGREGDRVVAVDGVPVEGPIELESRIPGAVGRAAPGAGEVTVTLTVERSDGALEDLRVVIPVQPRPQLGIAPWSGRTVTALRGGSPVGDLLRKGDVLLAVGPTDVEDFTRFRDRASPSATVDSITVESEGTFVELEVAFPLTELELAEAVAGSMDFESTRIATFLGRPAERAGLRSGDRVLSVRGRPVRAWRDIQEAIVSGDMSPIEIEVERAGGMKETVTVQPAGSPETVLLGYQFAPPTETYRETNLLQAVAMGWHRSIHWMESVVLTIRGLVTRRVATDKIGGPLFLAEATYRIQQAGWARFLYLLAIISINLAILNLLPIPVLDGGQILLLVAEKVRGKPLPERVVGYLQFVGLLMILGLMALAFYNDIARLFGGP